MHQAACKHRLPSAFDILEGTEEAAVAGDSRFVEECLDTHAVAYLDTHSC